MNVKNLFVWTLRIVAAVIMLQTLFFKFTAHPESVQLFSELGVEPWGRIATGILELFASILILIPPTSYLGSILAVGLMSGAIFSHLTVLGVSYGGSPLLFTYAVVVFLASAILLYLDKKRLLGLFRKYSKIFPSRA
jgi:uncharacterized membrane protein YphA (DoxX/SURF4 family)